MTQKTNVSQDMIINIVERAVTEVTVQAFLIQHALTVNCAVPALCEIGNILRTVPTNSEVLLPGRSLCKKSRCHQGLLRSKKKIGGSHANFRDN